MAEKFTINSDQTLKDFFCKVAEDYAAQHYLRGSYLIGPNRTIPQNRMDFELYTLIAEFQGLPLQDVRNIHKLNHGIPIIRRDDESKNIRIGRLIDHLTYEEQVSAMELVNVTSIMTRPQQAEYIQTIIDTCLLYTSPSPRDGLLS